MKSKLFGMDKNNRSVTLLRYLTLFTVQNLEEFFITEQIKSVVNESIYEYFYPNNEKKKNIKLISVYVHTNYVEINFQALPVLKLKETIEELHIYSNNYILDKLQQLKRKNLWSENIFLATRRQLVKQQVKAYLGIQKTIGTYEKL